MVWWQGWDDLRWWSSHKQAEIRGRKGTGWVDRNEVGAEELKDEMVELKEPLGRASKTLRGPCRGPRSMQKGVSEMERFLYPSLAWGPRSSNPGQGGHPDSPDLWDLGPEPKPRPTMGERQEWPIPMLLAPEPPLVNACQPTVRCTSNGLATLGGVGSVSASASPPLPTPRSLCLAWRKALLSSAAPRPEHLELLCRVCGLRFPLP